MLVAISNIIIDWMLYQVYVVEGCSVGWVGKGCTLRCNYEGGCLGGVDNKRCRKGWFGHLCQYQDLLNFSTTSVISTSVPKETFIDYNDTSCVKHPKFYAINVMLKLNYTFQFIRIHSTDARNLNISVELVHEATIPVNCDNNRKAYVIGLNILDIYCNFNLTIKQINIYVDGNNTVCSVYISGGRHIGYGSDVRQSSVASQNVTYADAQKAIDGYRGQLTLTYGCSKSDETDYDPYYELTFKAPRILTKLILYNSAQQQAKLMENFFIRLMNYKLAPIYVYTHGSQPAAEFEYTVLFPPIKETVKRLVIRSMEKVPPNTVPVLHICELAIFGDCPKGFWGYECNKTCPVHCEGQCNALDGSCLAVCMFNTILPDCHRNCPNGTYGSRCQLNCSLGCNKGTCHHVTGECLSGCTGYSNPPKCTDKCTGGKYGFNCLLECHHNCKDVCDSITGKCSSVCHGFSNPPDCNKACTNGSYGPNCEQKCSHCTNQSCNHVDGTCTIGCEGYIDFPHCKKKQVQSTPKSECQPGTFGPLCSKRCGPECYLRQCNVNTSACEHGCNGFQDPPKCKTPCTHGHGLNCTCHDYCKRCELHSPSCAECKPGFKYLNVTKNCTTGNFLWKISQHYTEVMSSLLEYVPMTIFLLAVFVSFLALGIYASLHRSKHLSTGIEHSEDWSIDLQH